MIDIMKRNQFKIQPTLQPRKHVTTESTRMFILMIWPGSKQITLFTCDKIFSDLKTIKAVAELNHKFHIIIGSFVISYIFSACRDQY